MLQGRNDSEKRKRQQSGEVMDPIQEYLRLDVEQNPPLPPPPPPASPLRQAQFIAQQLFAMLMSAAVDFSQLHAEGYFRYLEWLIKESGNPGDPLQQMLLSQIAMAHFRIGTLHTAAAGATDKDAVEVYANAATRLTGELRRLILTLAEYRERSTTITRAGNTGAPIGYPVETPLPTSASAAEIAKTGTVETANEKKHCDTELSSNADRCPSGNAAAQPTSGGSRPEKSCQTWSNYGGGTRTPAPVGDAKSALGEVHRPADTGGKGRRGQKQRSKAEGREVREAAAVGAG